MIKREYLACCGLNCEECDAYKATKNNDDELRRKTAELWSQLNGTEITPEMINCVGCSREGVKYPFCQYMCPIKQCCQEKGLETCGQCEQMENCETLAMISSHTPEVLDNLRESREN